MKKFIFIIMSKTMWNGYDDSSNMSHKRVVQYACAGASSSGHTRGFIHCKQYSTTSRCGHSLNIDSISQQQEGSRLQHSTSAPKRRRLLKDISVVEERRSTPCIALLLRFYSYNNMTLGGDSRAAALEL